MNPNDKLVMDNSINWFSKFTMKRQIFEQVRKKCDVDSALREEEEAMELEDSDDWWAKSRRQLTQSILLR